MTEQLARRLIAEGVDASAASMFLIKFMDQIQHHNMKEAEHYV